MYQSDSPETPRKEIVAEDELIPRWIILLFVALTLLRGCFYAAIFPPWVSPDEHGHFEYAWLISQYGPFVGPESISLEFQQRVLESMYEFEYWRFAHAPMPEVLPTSFTDPNDKWLSFSRPQVGDERPLYYSVVGVLLRLVDNQDVVIGMYIGRAISILLYAAAVGVTALTTRRLFPLSYFMQIVPPAFLLFLPMLGEMGAAVNSDAMGTLTSTLFFASLIPIFRAGLTWRRVGTTVAMLSLTLLSKKTTLFLIPTALLALPVYGWVQGVKLSRRIKLILAIGIVVIILILTALALIPGGDARGWVEQTGNCGATRVEDSAFEGKAALRIGACTDERVAQMLQIDSVRKLYGQQIHLKGWIRSVEGEAIAQAVIKDSEGQTETEILAGQEWQPFAITHTVDPNARTIAIRLVGGGSGPVLFDDLVLSSANEKNLLINGTAEKSESLLLDLLSNAITKAGAPSHLIERMLSPQSWNSQAWQDYIVGTNFCLQSFWGVFGSIALMLPLDWYPIINVACLMPVVGNLIFLIRKPQREWLAGFLLVLMGGLLLLGLQTFLPMVKQRATYWLPQGRYLFPGVFAIAVLIAWGIYQLLPKTWERRATLIVVGLFVGFDLLCLFYLIIPYFRST